MRPVNDAGQEVKTRAVSSAQRNETGDLSELNVNVALLEDDCIAGLITMVVSGGVVSMVHVYDAGDCAAFPGVSVALASSVWVPSARPA